MKNLITHPQFGEIRMKTIKGEPWFCAKDVCEVLTIKNHRDAITALDEDEKGVGKIYTLGGNQELTLVNESGLYTLIMRSNKPEARKFRKWVTGEVLPAIRKYGFYTTDPKLLSRAEEKANRQKIADMLKEVRGHLSMTDIRLVAKQCRCTEWQVQKVLHGEITDSYMLQLLYARATGNKLLKQQFYTPQGAEKLLEALRNV